MKHTILTRLATGALAAALAVSLVGCGTGNQTPSASSAPAAASTAAATAPTQTVPEETVSFPVNINTADVDTLTALPGIGQVLAKRILAYRRQNGSFRAVEEITNVEGIGEKKAEAILELITVGG